MTENENTSYLPKNHPVRYLLDLAATGHLPTKAELDTLDRPDLPDCDNPAQFRSDVAAAARKVAEAGEGGYNARGRQQAGAEWSAIAQRMTPGARAIDGTGQDEPLEAITRRMFQF